MSQQLEDLIFKVTSKSWTGKLTAKQRADLVDSTDSEYFQYDASEISQMSDKQLCNAVYRAWSDYVSCTF